MINAEKINKLVESEEKKALNLLKEEEFFPQEEQEDSLENEEILADLADEPVDPEEIENIEEPIENEESIEIEEDSEYIDVTGFVELAEDGENFNINNTIEVTLQPGNKIKFTVDEEEYTGVIESIDEETGLASISIASEEDEDLEDTGMELDIKVEDDNEEIGDNNEEVIEDEETIIESIIMEDETEIAVEETPIVDNQDAGSEDASGLDALTMGEEPVDNGGGEDISLGSGPSMSTGAPADDTEMSMSSDAAEETPSTDAASDTSAAIEATDDLNQIISDLINDSSELDTLAGLQENDLMQESETLKSETPDKKVKQINQPAKKVVKIGDGPLNTETPDKKVVDKGNAHEKPEEPSSKVKDGGDGHEKPEEPNSKIKGQSEKSVKDPKATNKPSAQMKTEAVKAKALEILAENYLKLQEEYEKVKLQNYKLLKVNGLLTLTEELSSTVKTQLVEKFDKCSTSKQVLDLYKTVTSLIKESRKPSLNSMIIGRNTGVKNFKTLTEATEKSKENVEKEGPNAEERRALYLSGDKRYEDEYMK